MNAMSLYRVERWCYLHHLTIIAKIVRMLIYVIHNCYIPYTADIGKGTKCGYKGMGVVIHTNAVIGENCLIAQQVTIGGKTGYTEVPVIGNNVYISTGAKIIGPVKVGDNAVIGANAVVIHDVPENCTVAGVPAKVLYNNQEREKENGGEDGRHWRM